MLSIATRRSRRLRRTSTDAELRLWYHLRDRRLNGHKFRRQHPIGHHFADFACVDRHIVVELDGGQHAQSRRFDDQRTQRLAELGWRVVRFWDDDVLLRADQVLEALLGELKK